MSPQTWPPCGVLRVFVVFILLFVFPCLVRGTLDQSENVKQDNKLSTEHLLTEERNNLRSAVASTVLLGIVAAIAIFAIATVVTLAFHCRKQTQRLKDENAKLQLQARQMRFPQHAMHPVHKFLNPPSMQHSGSFSRITRTSSPISSTSIDATQKSISKILTLKDTYQQQEIAIIENEANAKEKQIGRPLLTNLRSAMILQFAGMQQKFQSAKRNVKETLLPCKSPHIKSSHSDEASNYMYCIKARQQPRDKKLIDPGHELKEGSSQTNNSQQHAIDNSPHLDTIVAEITDPIRSMDSQSELHNERQPFDKYSKQIKHASFDSKAPHGMSKISPVKNITDGSEFSDGVSVPSRTFPSVNLLEFIADPLATSTCFKSSHVEAEDPHKKSATFADMSTDQIAHNRRDTPQPTAKEYPKSVSSVNQVTFKPNASLSYKEPSVNSKLPAEVHHVASLLAAQNTAQTKGQTITRFSQSDDAYTIAELPSAICRPDQPLDASNRAACHTPERTTITRVARLGVPQFQQIDESTNRRESGGCSRKLFFPEKPINSLDPGTIKSQPLNTLSEHPNDEVTATEVVRLSPFVQRNFSTQAVQLIQKATSPQEKLHGLIHRANQRSGLRGCNQLSLHRCRGSALCSAICNDSCITRYQIQRLQPFPSLCEDIYH